MLLTVIALNGKFLVIIKDALILNIKDTDATIISFIKIWLVLPLSFLFTYLYHRLELYLNKWQIFLLFTSVFSLFLLLFVLVMQPNFAQLQALNLFYFLLDIFPPSFRPFLVAIRDWPFTFFFLCSEMWMTFMLSFLFWSFALEVLNRDESRHYLGYFSLDFAGILAGLLGMYCSYLSQKNWDKFLYWSVSCVLALCMIQLALYYFSFKTYLNKDAKFAKELKKTKSGSFLRNSWHTLGKNELYKSIAFMTFFFEFCDHFLEIIWKSQVKNYFESASEISSYMSEFTLFTGILGVLVTLFISSPLLRKGYWKQCAQATPYFVVGSTIVLCLFMIVPQNSIIFRSLFYTDQKYLLLALCTAQASFLKISKFTFFDNSKEMAILQVDRGDRSYCRSLTVTVPSRLGKTLSALGWQGYTIIPQLSGSLLPIGALILVSAISWQKSVNTLNRCIHKTKVV